MNRILGANAAHRLFGLSLLITISLGFLGDGVRGQEFLRKLIVDSPGPLSKAHEEYDTLNGCINCHEKKLGGDVDNTKCLTCHPKIEDQIENEDGFHWNKPTCMNCHGDHKEKDGFIFAPKKDWAKNFNHELETSYPLRGKHGKIECFDCHDDYRSHYKTKAKTKTRSYLDTPTDCYTCHEDDYEHDFKEKALTECTQCHSQSIKDWKALSKRMKFNHDKTDYPLRGLHIPVKCSECHEPPKGKKRVMKFAPLSFDKCTDCHADPHKGKFGEKCSSCHSEFRKWDVIITSQNKKLDKSFDHDKTDYPLVGYHENIACEKCHFDSKANFKLADDKFDQCSDCHGDAHDTQFQDQKCEDCHAQDLGYLAPKYGIEEHSRTDFKLDGKHQVLDCNKCHFSGQYEELAHETCNDCHRNVHPQREIEQECSFCHVTTSFSWIQFDHNKNTEFRLTGQHREVACLSCHVDQVFKDMPADNKNPNCSSCHQDPHGDAMDNTCQDCHRTESFHLVRGFDHKEVGKWALDGKHQELSCQKCHKNHLLGDYKVPITKSGLGASDCSNCHVDVHRGEQGNNCQSCHNNETFASSQGEQVHDLGFSKFGGMHDELECNTCHADNTNLQGMSMACQNCHAKDDPHSGKFGPNCSDCHSQMAWVPSKFRHNQTAFRLTGAHRYAECSDCHFNQIYQGLPNDCFFCHSDSQLTTVASHNFPAAGGDTCTDCHTTIDWGILKGAGISSKVANP